MTTKNKKNKDCSCSLLKSDPIAYHVTIRACATGQFPSWFVEKPHFNFGRHTAHYVASTVQSSTLHNFKMADNSTKRAEGCGHPIFDRDCHKYCFPCRDKGKGEDICASKPQEECYSCISLTSEQKRKLVPKSKKKDKTKESSTVTKEMEDRLLQEDPPTTTSAPDPLALILSRLDDMQGKIRSLETGERPQIASTRVETEFSSFRREPSLSSSSTWCRTREEPEEGETTDGQEDSVLFSRKRDRSPSPEEFLDEAPTYRQTLASIRSVLELALPEDPNQAPSRMFGSRESKKKSLQPLSLPAVEAVVDRWKFYEKKTSGNPKESDPESLQDNPIASNNFLGYSRPYMKFYHTPTQDFSLTAPMCQQPFKALFQRPMPGSVQIPFRQACLMENICRENVQISQFSNWFVRCIDKCLMSLEATLQNMASECRSAAILKEIEKDLGVIQLQFNVINSLDKALESTTDNTIAMACNLELARRDSILKTCAP